MRLFIQWEPQAPFLTFGKPFKSPDEVKKRASALYKKHRRPVEVKDGFKVVASVFVKDNLTYFMDINGTREVLQ